tara:strand:- start:62 stop:472 length:411 start_codon:yes stop_codon:yes gene_type:complete
MARKRMGAHGSINRWTDNRMRLTIRPEPRAYTALEIAERLGSYIEVLYDAGGIYSDPDEDITYREAMIKIKEEKMTKKYVIDFLNRIWYMAQYEEFTDSIVSIDVEKYESHQAMYDWVLMTFPKLMPIGVVNEAEE